MPCHIISNNNLMNHSFNLSSLSRPPFVGNVFIFVVVIALWLVANDKEAFNKIMFLLCYMWNVSKCWYLSFLAVIFLYNIFSLLFVKNKIKWNGCTLEAIHQHSKRTKRERVEKSTSEVIWSPQFFIHVASALCFVVCIWHNNSVTNWTVR